MPILLSDRLVAGKEERAGGQGGLALGLTSLGYPGAGASIGVGWGRNKTTTPSALQGQCSPT